MSSLAKMLRRWLETVCGDTNKLLGDLAVGETLGDEPRDGELGIGHRLPTRVARARAGRAVGGPRGHGGGFARGPRPSLAPASRVQDERAVERLDRGVDRAGAGASDAEVLECGGARERSRPGREQVDGALEIVDVRSEQPAGVSRGRDDRRDARVELRAPVRLSRRDLGQFLVAGGERDADKLGLVGHVDREQRQDRGALILPERAQPIVRGARDRRWPSPAGRGAMPLRGGSSAWRPRAGRCASRAVRCCRRPSP